ncbi:hypothetical protein DLM78_01220 [Leptospira stimsonii]|uniref:Uncharacterized protein n=1 Tax=Leptospira stimsonii TaxID=2202203 RepID=A0A8B3CSH2_9LEPT|nr:hypothetical protein DLM78_01220 [Leptospira stimsonii]
MYSRGLFIPFLEFVVLLFSANIFDFHSTLTVFPGKSEARIFHPIRDRIPPEKTRFFRNRLLW